MSQYGSVATASPTLLLPPPLRIVKNKYNEGNTYKASSRRVSASQLRGNGQRATEGLRITSLKSLSFAKPPLHDRTLLENVMPVMNKKRRTIYVSRRPSEKPLRVHKTRISRSSETETEVSVDRGNSCLHKGVDEALAAWGVTIPHHFTLNQSSSSLSHTTTTSATTLPKHGHGLTVDKAQNKIRIASCEAVALLSHPHALVQSCASLPDTNDPHRQNLASRMPKLRPTSMLEMASNRASATMPDSPPERSSSRSFSTASRRVLAKAKAKIFYSGTNENELQSKSRASQRLSTLFSMGQFLPDPENGTVASQSQHPTSLRMRPLPELLLRKHTAAQSPGLEIQVTQWADVNVRDDIVIMWAANQVTMDWGGYRAADVSPFPFYSVQMDFSPFPGCKLLCVFGDTKLEQLHQNSELFWLVAVEVNLREVQPPFENEPPILRTTVLYKSLFDPRYSYSVSYGFVKAMDAQSNTACGKKPVFDDLEDFLVRVVGGKDYQAWWVEMFGYGYCTLDKIPIGLRPYFHDGERVVLN